MVTVIAVVGVVSDIDDDDVCWRSMTLAVGVPVAAVVAEVGLDDVHDGIGGGYSGGDFLI